MGHTSSRDSGADSLLISCDTCPVREVHCEQCMVTALLAVEPVAAGPPGDALALDADERRVVADLLRVGLVSVELAGAVRAQREPLPVRRAAG